MTNNRHVINHQSATLRYSLFKLVLLVLLVLVTGVNGVKAQQYVFLYKNGNDVQFLYGEPTTDWWGDINGYDVSATTVFDEGTCLFNGNTSNITTVTTFQYAANTSYYLRPRSGNYTYSINFTTSSNYRTWTNAGNGRVHYNNRYLL